jgi:predicted nucleic acid-binding protein
MMDVEQVFLDTNVLVYASVLESPWFKSAQDIIRRLENKNTTIYISRQIIREYIATLSRPQTFPVKLTNNDILAHISDYINRYNIIDENSAVTEKLFELFNKFEIGGKQIHDASIVATMLSHGVSTLITYNVTDFVRFSDLIKIAKPE